MKRSKDLDNNNSQSANNVVYRSAEVNDSISSRVNFDFDENDNIPIALPRKVLSNSNVPAPKERTLALSDESIVAPNGNNFQSLGTYVQEEIRPGVILEGYAVDI